MEDPYGGLSDGELAARVDGGDGQALNALCRRHYHSVFRLAYRLAQNRPEAEDCTQEAFTRFIRSWARWQIRDRGAGPWLSVVLRNVVADHWHKVGGVRPSPATLPSWADRAEPDLEDNLFVRERAAAVGTTLESLGSPCQELIGLLLQKGLTLVRAAEELGESPEAVKKRYQRCLKRLQAELEEWIA